MWEDLLSRRETAQLAYKAARDQGLDPAVRYLPLLLETFHEETDRPLLRAPMRGLIKAQGEEALKQRLEDRRSLFDPEQWSRLADLLHPLGITLSRSEQGKTAPSRQVDPNFIVADLFREKVGVPFLPERKTPKEFAHASPWG